MSLGMSGRLDRFREAVLLCFSFSLYLWIIQNLCNDISDIV